MNAIITLSGKGYRVFGLTTENPPERPTFQQTFELYSISGINPKGGSKGTLVAFLRDSG